jgi:SAM-dependent methyltransferase
MWSPMRLRVLLSALELGSFDAIADGAITAALVAKKTKASLRGTTMLLEELAALELLKKSGDKFTLSPEADLYLVASKPTYMGGMLQTAFRISQSWENLTEVVRTGKPVMHVEQTAEGAEFFKNLVRALYAASYASGNLLLPHLHVDSKEPVRVLDVAAGSAAWSLPIAENFNNTTVTVLDLPPVCDVAREFVERHNLTNRYDYLEGDLKKLNFGADKYDIIILGHICHSEGAKGSEKLIAKSAKALKRGGQLVIPDMVPNDKRTGPEFPLLFAINMLLHTTEGSTFSLRQYKDWLKAADLKFVRMLEPEQVGTQTIIARKP